MHVHAVEVGHDVVLQDTVCCRRIPKIAAQHIILAMFERTEQNCTPQPRAIGQPVLTEQGLVGDNDHLFYAWTAHQASNGELAPCLLAPTFAMSPADVSPDYAIVEASGQQFWLQPGRYYDFDRMQEAVDEVVTLDQVLMVKSGTTVTLGRPYVEGAKVTLKVLAHRRGPKVVVYKMRRKKKTRSKQGHRQELTRASVESIVTGTTGDAVSGGNQVTNGTVAVP